MINGSLFCSIKVCPTKAQSIPVDGGIRRFYFSGKIRCCAQPVFVPHIGIGIRERSQRIYIYRSRTIESVSPYC